MHAVASPSRYVVRSPRTSPWKWVKGHPEGTKTTPGTALISNGGINIYERLLNGCRVCFNFTRKFDLCARCFQNRRNCFCVLQLSLLEFCAPSHNTGWRRSQHQCSSNNFPNKEADQWERQILSRWWLNHVVFHRRSSLIDLPPKTSMTTKT